MWIRTNHKVRSNPKKYIFYNVIQCLKVITVGKVWFPKKDYFKFHTQYQIYNRDILGLLQLVGGPINLPGHLFSLPQWSVTSSGWVFSQQLTSVAAIFISNSKSHFFKLWEIEIVIFSIWGRFCSIIFKAFYEQCLNYIFSVHSICTAHDNFIIVTHVIVIPCVWAKNILSRALVAENCYYYRQCHSYNFCLQMN